MSPKKSGKASKQLQVEEKRPVASKEEESGNEDEEEMDDESGSDNNSSVEENETETKPHKDLKAGAKSPSGKSSRVNVRWFGAFFNIIRVHGTDASISMAELKERFYELVKGRGTPGQVKRLDQEWEKAVAAMKKNQGYRVVKDRVEVHDKITGKKCVFTKTS